MGKYAEHGVTVYVTNPLYRELLERQLSGIQAEVSAAVGENVRVMFDLIYDVSKDGGEKQ